MTRFIACLVVLLGLVAATGKPARAEDVRPLARRAWLTEADNPAPRPSSSKTEFLAVRGIPELSRTEFVATSGSGPTWSGAPLGAKPDPCGADPSCCSYSNWWNKCEWGGEIFLAAWLPGMKGTLGIGPHDTDIDVSVGDLLSNLDTILQDLEFFLQGGVAVQYGRWRLGLEMNGAELGQTTKVRQAGRDVDVDITVLNWQANVYYRAGMSRLGCGPCPQLLVYEPYVGVRGLSLDVDASRDAGIGLALDDHWVDPVIGGKVTWDLRNRWAVVVEGDIGGFGVSSDFTWKLDVGVGWRFARRWYLRAGWLIIDTDYETGSGLSRFKWDVTQSGPYLGVGFAF